MRENEQVEPDDRQVIEAGREQHRVHSGVDERDGACTSDEDSVPLADIAGRMAPVRRQGQRWSDPLPGQAPGVGAECDHEHSRTAEGEHPLATLPGTQAHQERRRECGKKQCAGRPGQPGQAGRRQGLHRRRDGGDPGRRQPGQPECQIGDGPGHGREDAAEKAEEGGERGCRRRQEIRRNAEDGNLRRQKNEHRLARELCGQRDGEGGGQRSGQDGGEQSRERAGECEQPGRRKDGEDEAVAAREPGVRDHHQQNDEAEHRYPRHRPASGHREQNRQRHQGCPHDAGLRCHQHDEQPEGGQRPGDPQPPGRTEERQQGRDDGDDDRAVGAGHCREMAQ